jgi:hypothetical protein
MALFSYAISAIAHDEGFAPQPVAEAKQADLEVSEDAALSRLRPIQDGPDLWQEHRSSAATVSGFLLLLPRVNSWETEQKLTRLSSNIDSSIRSNREPLSNITDSSDSH